MAHYSYFKLCGLYSAPHVISDICQVALRCKNRNAIDISRCVAITGHVRFSAIFKIFTLVKKLYYTRKKKIYKDLSNIYKVGRIPNLPFVLIFFIKRCCINFYSQISYCYCILIKRHTVICLKIALCHFIQIHTNTVFYLFFSDNGAL